MTTPKLGDRPASEMTVRELFAMTAMQGLLSDLKGLRWMGFKDEEIELFAAMRADALLHELERVR